MKEKYEGIINHEMNKFKLCQSDECKDKVFEYRGEEYHGTMNNPEENQCIECGADLAPHEENITADPDDDNIGLDGDYTGGDEAL